IRISSEDAKIRFNHGEYGLVPAAGGMSMLSTLIAPTFARSWVLTGAPIKKETLTHSGFISSTYTKENRQETIHKTLSSIAGQAPVQRIQGKLGLFETLRSQFEAGLVMDRKIAKASMISEDWKNTKKKEVTEEESTGFMPAKSMS